MDKAINEQVTFNCLPMICLVEIAGFIDIDKKCLAYKSISKKFNEAIQLKFFMKTKNGDAEFYKKYFLILNTKCHKYFNDNIYPFLVNADSVYQFFSLECEETFNKLFNYCFNEIKSIIISNKLKMNLKTLESSFKKAIIKFLTATIVTNFENEDYDSLDFKKLVPYNDAKEMIILLVRLMKKLNYFNLSHIKVNDDIFLDKLIGKIEAKNNFILVLEGISISKKLVNKIKIITDNNMGLKIIIDKKYNGEFKQLGGKKMNKQKNINKKKFKNLEFIK